MSKMTSMLDSFIAKGMDSHIRDAEPPSLALSRSLREHKNNRALSRKELESRNRMILQREANEKQRAKDYQDALTYSRSDYLDDGSHFVARAVAQPQRTTPVRDSLRQKAQHHVSTVLPRKLSSNVRKHVIHSQLSKAAKTRITPNAARLAVALLRLEITAAQGE